MSSGIVILLGLANLRADGFSMEAGNFLGMRAENQSESKARRGEEREIETHPQGEQEEIQQIFAAKGFKGETLEEVVKVITADRKRWVDTMMQEEHGISGNTPSAFKGAPIIFTKSDTEKLKITSVCAYPVKLWERSDQGKLPEFESDLDWPPRMGREFRHYR